MDIIIIVAILVICCCIASGGGGYYYYTNNMIPAPVSGSSAPVSGSSGSASGSSAPASDSSGSASDSSGSEPSSSASASAPTTPSPPAPITTPEIKIPKFIIRIGGTNWANLIQNGDESATNIQTWGPPPDNQFKDLNFALRNQIAAQFRYFAQFWLNKTGKSSGSTNVFAPLSNNLGEYKFSVNGTSYTGSFNGTSWSWNYDGDYCFTRANAQKRNICMNGWEFQNGHCYASGNSNGNISTKCSPYSWTGMAGYSQAEINSWITSCGASNTSNCK